MDIMNITVIKAFRDLSDITVITTVMDITCVKVIKESTDTDMTAVKETRDITVAKGFSLGDTLISTRSKSSILDRFVFLLS
jgi:phosphoribosylformylglycinamidine (FGAM) synthase-like amidotransferase family enzyme